MPSETIPFVPYPPIERHGVVGDRRTAVLVAADGNCRLVMLYRITMAIRCSIPCSTLSQAGSGALGPEIAALGTQRYEATGSAVLTTSWESATGTLVSH